jgi:hypothetical protein
MSQLATAAAGPALPNADKACTTTTMHPLNAPAASAGKGAGVCVEALSTHSPAGHPAVACVGVTIAVPAQHSKQQHIVR